ASGTSQFYVSGVTSGLNYDGSRFALASGQTLNGVGTVIGAMSVRGGATVAPGQEIGTLSTGSIFFSSASSVFNPELKLSNGPDADLLSVTGNVALSNAALNLQLTDIPSIGLADSLTFLILRNDASDPISGSFGSILVPSGYGATVDYAFSGTDALGRVGDRNDLA